MAILLAAIIMFAACKDGDTGPAGPPGTANVQYSDWQNTTKWTGSSSSTGAGKNTFYFDIAEARVTQEIVDKGSVLVFMQFVADPDSAGIIKQLPSIYYNIGSASTQYRFQHGIFPGKIRIICDVIPNGIPATTNKVRYVIIPGGVNVNATARAVAPDYSRMSYEEICRLYHLQP
ncbi:hypothetical protein SAMN05444266_106488 [Chitinophaga jiangningensis]|uniref:Collagen triple helix repeat-containing protein n=2 Tax=Chitinophaga jiangningensis TaxID=1419482 RepID=A0A1M7GBQ0_9BACT|nr:hypothetical protein SAMN05444266_106488 [Chitinophaga jiangningensis]